MRTTPRVLTLAILLGLSTTAHAIELDRRFGVGGKTLTSLGVGTNGAMAGLGFLADGKILVAGTRLDEGGVQQILLARYTTNGSLDSSFSNAGLAQTALPQSVYPAAAVLLGDGRMLVAGARLVGSLQAIFVARFLPSGDLDPAFGTAGLATATFSSLQTGANDVAIQPDGGIVVAGYAGANGQYDFAAVRFLSDGTLDTGFGNAGWALVDLGGGLESAYAVVAETSGRIALGGLSDGPGTVVFGMAGLLADGSLDPAFGNNGRLLPMIGISAECDALALAPDGKIVASGAVTTDSAQALGVVRLTPAGVLDPSFGSGGISLLPVGGSVYSVVVDHEGRVDVAATSRGDFLLARLLANGLPDVSVGPEAGRAPTSQGVLPLRLSARVVSIERDGAIVIGGVQDIHVAGTFTSLALARYTETASAIPTLSLETLMLLAVVLAGIGALLLARRG